MALAVAACSFGGQSSNGGGSLVDAAGTGAVCGDNVCAATEVNSCPQDCGSGGNQHNAVCGNGTCESGETSTSCPSDCGGGSNGGGAVCGNGVCETGETTSCPSDCPSGGGSGALNCSDPTVLLACFTCVSGGGCTGVDMAGCTACLGGGSGASQCNNNGVCDPGETSAACPLDNCP